MFKRLLVSVLIFALCVTPFTVTKAAGYSVPEPPAYEVDALARLIYGEARGVASTQEKAAVAWCVFNRVDDCRYPNSVMGVITQRYQFSGYSDRYPVLPELKALARDCMIHWYATKQNPEHWGRVLPRQYIYFYGYNGRNHFRDELGNKYTWWRPNVYLNWR